MNSSQDTLSIELQLEDSSFDSTLNRDQQKLENFGKNVPPVKVKIDGKEAESGLLSLEKTAVSSRKEIKAVESQLSDLYKIMSQTTNKSVLQQLTSEAKALEKELLVLKEQAGKINLKSPVAASLPANPSQTEKDLQRGALRGLGIPRGLTTAAALGAFVVARGAEDLFKDALKATEDDEKRTRQLTAVVNELGLSYESTSVSSKKFGSEANISAKDAQASFINLLKLSKDTRTSIDTLSSSFADIAAAKNIDGDKLPGILENINKGIADAAVFGENGAAVFDQYAASLGTTADKLTLSEKRQALMNESLNQAAISAGAANEKMNSLEGRSQQLNKTWEELLTNIGNKATPAVLAVLGLLNTSIGGQASKTQRSSFYLFENQDEGVFAEEVKEAKEKQKAFLENFQKNQKQLQDAVNNPDKNLVNFAYSHFVNQNGFSSLPVQAQNEALKKGIELTNEYAESYKKNIETAISTKNINYLKDLRAGLPNIQAAFNPQDFAEISHKITDTISQSTVEGFRIGLQKPEIKPTDIQKLIKQIQGSNDLLPNTQQGLIYEAQNKLNQLVDSGKNKVFELRKSYENLFDSLYQKQGANNPFAAIFTTADKELTKLRETLRGASPELQKLAESLLNKQTNEALFNARLSNQLDGFNLRSQAEDLRNFEKNRLEDYKDNQRKALRDALVSNYSSANPLSAQAVKDKFEQEELSSIVASEIADVVEKAIKNQSTFRGINATFGGLNPKSDIGLTEVAVKEKTFGSYYRYDLTNGLDKIYDRLGSGGTISRQKTFEDLTDSERNRFLESANNTDTNRNRTFRDRLDRQIDLIDQLAGKTGTQEAVDTANRKIIALTEGIDPSRLNNRERGQLAVAREQQAKRTEEFEREGRQLQKDQLKATQQIALNQARLITIAEKEGIKGIELLIKDQTNGSIVLPQTPTPKDTARRTNGNDAPLNSTFSDDYQNR